MFGQLSGSHSEQHWRFTVNETEWDKDGASPGFPVFPRDERGRKSGKNVLDPWFIGSEEWVTRLPDYYVSGWHENHLSGEDLLTVLCSFIVLNDHVTLNPFLLGNFKIRLSCLYQSSVYKLAFLKIRLYLILQWLGVQVLLVIDWSLVVVVVLAERLSFRFRPRKNLNFPPKLFWVDFKT